LTFPHETHRIELVCKRLAVAQAVSNRHQFSSAPGKKLDAENAVFWNYLCLILRIGQIVNSIPNSCIDITKLIVVQVQLGSNVSHFNPFNVFNLSTTN
jgi:hypothetical protein